MTGGHIGSALLDSTEIYQNNAWTTAAAKLPAKMIDMRATTVNNKILVFGIKMINNCQAQVQVNSIQVTQSLIIMTKTGRDQTLRILRFHLSN